MTHADEWRTALYRDPGPDLDDRPDPADIVLDDKPLADWWEGCPDCGAAWKKPLCNCDLICTRCNRNETRRRGEVCWECRDDLLAEEAVDRGRGGEWE